MKIILAAFAMAFIANVNNCFGQKTVTYVAHVTLSGKPREFTLIDKSNGTKYTLDSTRIFITAINTAGKQLWKTDSWKDSKLDTYRVERPVVARFLFGNYYYGDSIIYVNKWKQKNIQAKEIQSNRDKYTREVLWVVYNNTQFGILNRATGAFEFHGQD